MLHDVFQDEAHRTLAGQLLESASDAHKITVDTVEFGERDPDKAYSWLCYIADPEEETLITSLTVTSASDHLQRYNPNGYLANAGDRLTACIYELETSGEAPFVLLGPEGEDVLFSPWMQNLLVVRATFNYAPV